MLLVKNAKAFADYEILKEITAGIQLTGPEVKSLRLKMGSLRGSFVKVVGQELFLLGAQITPYKFADNRDYDPTRTRKLLVKKSEIFGLEEASQIKGRTLIPLSFELMHGKIKLKLAIARGKKQFERREELKRKAIQRDTEREIKQKIRV